MNPRIKRVLVVLGVVFLLIQFYPVSRPNPPIDADLQAPADVKAILRRSCYDCHSNETEWPIYAFIAPVSWLVASDVEHGRGELNFSIWGKYDPNKRLSKASSIMEQVDEGFMPMKQYLWMHPGAKLSKDDIDALRRWTDTLE